MKIYETLFFILFFIHGIFYLKLAQGVKERNAGKLLFKHLNNKRVDEL